MLVRATYMYGVVLHAHPVRGESHNQGNTNGEVATLLLNLNTFSQEVHLKIEGIEPNGYLVYTNFHGSI